MDAPGNERAMFGNAMFTIVASMKATALPSDAIASTVRGEGLRCISVPRSAQQLRVGFERFSPRRPSPTALGSAFQPVEMNRPCLVHLGPGHIIGLPVTLLRPKAGHDFLDGRLPLMCRTAMRAVSYPADTFPVSLLTPLRACRVPGVRVPRPRRLRVPVMPSWWFNQGISPRAV